MKRILIILQAVLAVCVWSCGVDSGRKSVEQVAGKDSVRQGDSLYRGGDTLELPDDPHTFLWGVDSVDMLKARIKTMRKHICDYRLPNGVKRSFYILGDKEKLITRLYYKDGDGELRQINDFYGQDEWLHYYISPDKRNIFLAHEYCNDILLYKLDCKTLEVQYLTDAGCCCGVRVTPKGIVVAEFIEYDVYKEKYMFGWDGKRRRCRQRSYSCEELEKVYVCSCYRCKTDAESDPYRRPALLGKGFHTMDK